MSNPVLVLAYFVAASVLRVDTFTTDSFPTGITPEPSTFAQVTTHLETSGLFAPGTTVHAAGSTAASGSAVTTALPSTSGEATLASSFNVHLQLAGNVSTLNATQFVSSLGDSLGGVVTGLVASSSPTIMTTFFVIRFPPASPFTNSSVVANSIRTSSLLASYGVTVASLEVSPQLSTSSSTTGDDKSVTNLLSSGEGLILVIVVPCFVCCLLVIGLAMCCDCCKRRRRERSLHKTQMVNMHHLDHRV
eukprot:TRINITY_DN2863_c0_g1_i1.p1 TRINITY_DN2863_c0_g1~~TRINITY_DN2863_c0_g1_i1.p1  ORF type:complete len:248 (+),score=0.74 TRINITY_DN2863_c0_g1_i1:189-932(+)